MTVAVAAMTLASAFALYVVNFDVRALEQKVLARERALDRAEADIAVLAAERAHLARPERIEPHARALGFVPLQREQKVRLDQLGSGAAARPPLQLGAAGGAPRP
jgi:hypothetical protein